MIMKIMRKIIIACIKNYKNKAALRHFFFVKTFDKVTSK